MPENGQDIQATPSRRLIIEVSSQGLQLKAENLGPDDVETYLLKALAVVQRGMVVGQINVLLDQRRAADKAMSLVRRPLG
jgi:hypothetical protein